MEWMINNWGLVAWTAMIVGLVISSLWREQQVLNRNIASEQKVGQALAIMVERIGQIHDGLVEEGRWNWTVWCCWLVLTRSRNTGHRHPVDYEIVSRSEWQIEIRFIGFPWGDDAVVVFSTDPAGFPTLCEAGAPKPLRVRPYRGSDEAQEDGSTRNPDPSEATGPPSGLPPEPLPRGPVNRLPR